MEVMRLLGYSICTHCNVIIDGKKYVYIDPYGLNRYHTENSSFSIKSIIGNNAVKKLELLRERLKNDETYGVTAFTSCYDNVESFPKYSFRVNIENEYDKYSHHRSSKKDPRGLYGKSFDVHLWEVAPPYEMFYKYKNNKMSKKEFERRYYRFLSCQDYFVSGLADYIRRTGRPYKPVIIMSFQEKNGKCFRHVLRQYLIDKYNINIKEL